MPAFAIAFLISMLASWTWACPVTISKTASQLSPVPTCVEDYFFKVNLGQMTLEDDDRTGMPILFKDSKSMSFSDYLLFKWDENTDSLGLQGRRLVLKEIISAYKKSLRNDFSACEIKIYSNDQEISFDSLIETSRTEAGQPGTRWMLTKDDVSAPSWKLHCKDSLGQPVIEKQGNYFFFFVDVIENTNPQLFKDHLIKYLFSFRP